MSWPIATRVSAVLLAGLVLGAAQRPATSPRVTAGTGTLYLGVQPNRILIIDEATERAVGEITTQFGAPRQMALSHDRRLFYLFDSTYEHVQVIDIASRAVVDTFTLSEANRKVRIRSFESDPLNRFLVLLTKTATKRANRFEVGPPTLQQYDLKEHKIIRTIPWPKGEEREFVNILFSPDGKLLYFFSDDVLIYETSEFTQVDKWELSRPIEDGLGRMDFMSMDRVNDEPGYFTGLFSVRDPVQNRQVMGVARVNLVGKRVDFYALGPMMPVSFSLAPDRKRAYGLMQQIGHYEFWTFDLEGQRLHSKVEFKGRPRMALKPSSNGKVLYLYQAGNTIDLYEAATYRYLRTITLEGDMTTDLVVMPGPQGRAEKP